MTDLAVPQGLPAPPDGVARLRARWHAADPRVRVPVQLGVLLVAVAAAYGYSLLTLLQNAEMQTPLAYTSLVPVISLCVAFVCRRPARTELAIHDRQLDYIVGLPLIATALAVNVTLPSKFSVMFWVWRLDLLSLPIFVAGLVAILFGVRVLWRQKFAIGYLLLAWPWPYSSVLLRVLDASTSATLVALRAVLRVIPVAKPLPSGDGSLFSVAHAGHSFPISVVSACSGINGVVGFLLVGVAFVGVVRGPWVRKALWLGTGMLLLWAVNLGRLLLIFWAGQLFGEGFAVNVLHPFVGVVTFSIGVAIMAIFIKPLGMRLGRAVTPADAGGRRHRQASDRPPSPTAVPKVAVAIVCTLVAALVLGAADFGLRSFDLVANAAGEPKLLAFRSAPTAPVGWGFRVSQEYEWAKPLFGDDSTWFRYVFSPSHGGGNLRSSDGVTADIVDTPDLQTFSAYGVESCYQFHGYTLQDVSQVAIGGGITGQSLSFSGLGQQSWSVVYWIVPVQSGKNVRYERYVLYRINAPGGPSITLPHGVRITNLSGSLGTTGRDVVLARNRAFLVSFAHEMVVDQAILSSSIAAHHSSAATSGAANRQAR